MRVAIAAVAIVAAAAVLGAWLVLEEPPSNALPPAPAPAPSAKRKPWVTPSPETVAAPGDAALWLRRQWLHAEPSAAELAGLQRALDAAGIRRVYPFLGAMDAAGRPGWKSLGVHTPWEPEKAKVMLAAVPGALPWTGGVAGRDVTFYDPAQLAAFAGAMKQVVGLGAAGVHINIEPIADGHAGFLRLLEQVKEAIGSEKELSVSVVAPRHAGLEMAGNKYWSLEYLALVCGPADEIVVMGYDTWLEDAAAYQRVVADWTVELARELPADCGWRMGVPTYDDDAPHHRLDVERIDVALRGVREGLARLDRVPPGFRGIALYASWTTDAQEWAAYDALWRGRAPTATVIPEPVR